MTNVETLVGMSLRTLQRKASRGDWPRVDGRCWSPKVALSPRLGDRARDVTGLRRDVCLACGLADSWLTFVDLVHIFASAEVEELAWAVSRLQRQYPDLVRRTREV